MDTSSSLAPGGWPALLAVERMPQVPGLPVPGQLYCVLDRPALLGGMGFPRCVDWSAVWDAGFRHVVCLTGDRPPYDPAPLGLAHAVALEDLHHGRAPADPAREEAGIRAAALAVLDPLHRGEGVLVHCVAGTGRTGTVIGCVLRHLGIPAPRVVAYLDDLNRRRGGRGWPESPWQRDVVARVPPPAPEMRQTSR
jgi:hypothetical protein